MTARLRPGKVYRTEEFTRYDSNPTRWASKLVERGELRRLRHGLYHVPRTGAFGDVPPSEDELLRAYFRGRPYLRTGPAVWNGLGLGTTVVEVTPLVYNTTRSGEVELGGRRFELRRVQFPEDPDREYFVIDLLENAERAGADRTELKGALAAAVAKGRFAPELLRDQARKYGTRATRDLVETALAAAQAR